jgi:uncharacterized membrane protein
MKLETGDAVNVLRALIQEDRTESRICRDRIQNVAYALAVASFAISAFMIAKVPAMKVEQLRDITILVDLGLVAVMLIFLARVKGNLALLRRTLKGRQNLLNNLNANEVRHIDPFQSFHDVKPDIQDDDVYWEAGLPVGVVLIKMLVLTVYAASFIGT